MKLKISASADAIKDSGTSSYINSSGVYDVKILFASLDTNANGATQLNFNVSHNGNEQTIYGPYIINKDGNQNTIGMGLLNKLGIISGLADGDDLDTEVETHKVGKDKISKEFTVITNFTGLDVKLRIQASYGQYNNEIRKNLSIRNVFSAAGGTASEIVNNAEIGRQLAIETEKYSSDVTYEDGVTKEQAEAWEASRKAARASSTTPTPTSAVTEKRSGMFK